LRSLRWLFTLFSSALLFISEKESKTRYRMWSIKGDSYGHSQIQWLLYFFLHCFSLLLSKASWYVHWRSGAW
jgi:hypothetical protein